MKNEPIKLKPCPFCGHETYVEVFEGGMRVRCANCGATIDWRDKANSEKPNLSCSEKLNNCNDAATQAWDRIAPHKPTYEELEEMVKPLEWKDEDTCDVSRANITPYLYFKATAYGDCYLVRLNENGHFLHSIGIVEDGEKSLDAQKQNAQKWLVDLVADALGVERSGK